MAEKENKETKTRPVCPYCDTEMADANLPYCEVCKVKVLRCPVCHAVIDRETLVCSHCGSEIREA